jgi:hypothetical protein
MSKKRTKKDKARAKSNRKKQVNTAAGKIEPEMKVKTQKKEGLVLDSSYVTQDLKKTLVVTLIVLIVLGIIALLYT